MSLLDLTRVLTRHRQCVTWTDIPHQCPLDKWVYGFNLGVVFGVSWCITKRGTPATVERMQLER